MQVKTTRARASVPLGFSRESRVLSVKNRTPRGIRRPKMRSTTAGLLLLIGSANSLSLGLAPVRRSAVHRIAMQVSERQPH